MAAETVFGNLSDDVVLNIFNKLEDDPRNWARLACACTKFSSLIRNVCWKSKCLKLIHSDLIPGGASAEPPGGWSSLHKLAVCCPGLLHSGVLFENSDFGLERELGPDEYFRSLDLDTCPPAAAAAKPSSSQIPADHESSGSTADSSHGGLWSLYDDLYFDTIYNNSEELPENDRNDVVVGGKENDVVQVGREFPVKKRRKICRSMRSHLASGVWNLSREQGNKLLHSRFRNDSLYICDWPGCVHIEEKRSYMLFRGIFKDFKGSQVWRNIMDGKRSKVDLNCAYCTCKESWDLHSAFCLRRGFGYHDDGDPVVRAYVCENGHVSGAWTEMPLYA